MGDPWQEHEECSAEIEKLTAQWEELLDQCDDYAAQLGTLEAQYDEVVAQRDAWKAAAEAAVAYISKSWPCGHPTQIEDKQDAKQHVLRLFEAARKLEEGEA